MNFPETPVRFVMNRFKLRFLFIFWGLMLILVCTAVSATSLFPARSYTLTTDDGRSVFVMLLDYSSDWDGGKYEFDGYTQSGLYAAGDKNNPLWTVDWYAKQVRLSTDGHNLVRLFNPQRADQAAVAFYNRGVLQLEYLVRDLVKDNSKLEQFFSSLVWRRNVVWDQEASKLKLTTMDHKFYTFDARTGLIIGYTR